MQYIVVVKIFPVQKVILILGIWGPNDFFYLMYIIYKTYGTFLYLLKIRFMFNCFHRRNRTVGFYEEKT